MAGVCLLAFIAGLLLEVSGLPVEENTGKRQMRAAGSEEAAKCRGRANIGRGWWAGRSGLNSLPQRDGTQKSVF